MFFQEAPTGNSTLFRTLAQETGLLESTQLEVEDGHLRLHLSESTIHTHSVVGEGNLCNVSSKNLDETRYFSSDIEAPAVTSEDKVGSGATEVGLEAKGLQAIS